MPADPEVRALHPPLGPPFIPHGPGPVSWLYLFIDGGAAPEYLAVPAVGRPLA